MRAIDADALLNEVMERHCKECDKRKGIKNGKYRIIYEIGDAPCRACDVYDVKDELEDAPTIEPEPHWIPCSERLPETEEQVLIYAWNVHYVLAKYKEIRTCDGVYKMAWVTEDAYNIPQEIKHEVICWMPLPEPYREEGD